MATKKNNGLIPPPPPMALPSIIQPMAAPASYAPSPMAGPQMPQFAPPQVPQMAPEVQLPAAPNTQSMISGPSDQDLAALREYSNFSGKFANMRMSQAQQPPFEPITQLQQSPFEQQFQQQLQQKILDNMSSGNGVSDRFGKGFDIGQQLAASVVIPAMGSFGSGNNAIGSMQAAQMIQEGVKGRRQERSANKAALNNSLVGLASLYENISPNSAKNISALLKMNMERQAANLKYQNEALGDVRQSMAQGGTALKDLLEIQGKAGDRKADAASTDYNNQMKGAEMQRNLGNDAFNQAEGRQNLLMKGQGLALQGEGLELQKQRAQTQESQFQQRIGLDQKVAESNAAGQLLSRMQQPMSLGAKALPFGGGKAYPGIGQDYANNPAAMEAFQKLGKMAGVEGAPFQQAPPAQPATPPQQPSFMQWLLGGSNPQQQPAAPALPVADVMKNPRLLQLDQTHTAMLANASKDPASVAQALTPVIQQQLGGNATPEQIAKILNQLVGGK